MTNQMPDEHDHDKRIITKPNSFIVNAVDADGHKKPKFTKLYLYISLLSEVGCQLNVEYECKKQDKNVRAWSKLGNFIKDLPVDTADEQNVLTREDPYYREYLKMQKEKDERVKERAETMRNAAQTLTHPLAKVYHADQVKARGEEIAEYKHKEKLFLVNKWQYLRVIKANLLEEKLKQLEIAKRARLIAHLIFTQATLSILANNYNKKKELRQYKERSQYCALLAKQKFQRYIIRLGFTQRDRLRAQFRCVFAFIHNLQWEPLAIPRC